MLLAQYLTDIRILCYDEKYSCESHLNVTFVSATPVKAIIFKHLPSNNPIVSELRLYVHSCGSL